MEDVCGNNLPWAVGHCTLMQCFCLLAVLVGLQNTCKTESDGVVTVSIDASPVHAGPCGKLAFFAALVSCVNGVEVVLSHRFRDEHSVTFQYYALFY